MSIEDVTQRVHFPGAPQVRVVDGVQQSSVRLTIFNGWGYEFG